MAHPVQRLINVAAVGHRNFQIRLGMVVRQVRDHPHLAVGDGDQAFLGIAQLGDAQGHVFHLAKHVPHLDHIPHGILIFDQNQKPIDGVPDQVLGCQGECHPNQTCPSHQGPHINAQLQQTQQDTQGTNHDRRHAFGHARHRMHPLLEPLLGGFRATVGNAGAEQDGGNGAIDGNETQAQHQIGAQQDPDTLQINRRAFANPHRHASGLGEQPCHPEQTAAPNHHLAHLHHQLLNGSPVAIALLGELGGHGFRGGTLRRSRGAHRPCPSPTLADRAQQQTEHHHASAQGDRLLGLAKQGLGLALLAGGLQGVGHDRAQGFGVVGGGALVQVGIQVRDREDVVLIHVQHGEAVIGGDRHFRILAIAGQKVPGCRAQVAFNLLGPRRHTIVLGGNLEQRSPVQLHPSDLRVHHRLTAVGIQPIGQRFRQGIQRLHRAGGLRHPRGDRHPTDHPHPHQDPKQDDQDAPVQTSFAPMRVNTPMKVKRTDPRRYEPGPKPGKLRQHDLVN